MKRLWMILILFAAIGSMGIHEAKAINIYIKFTLGKGNECTGRGLCSITIGGGTSMAGDIQGGNTQTIGGTAEIKGEQLNITLAKPLSDEAANERGQKIYVVRRPQSLSPDVAKQLGYKELILQPGEYLLNGNSFLFNVRAVAAGPGKGAATSVK